MMRSEDAPGEEELGMAAYGIGRMEYRGKSKNLYTVYFRCWSGYTKNWSRIERDIYADSIDDLMKWADAFMDEDREYWKKNKIDNKIELQSYCPLEVPMNPYYPEWLTELENRLEGCLGDD